MNTDELLAFVAEALPSGNAAAFSIEQLDERVLRLRLAITKANLRPGGSVSGPALMMLTDTATYLLLLSQIGRVPLAVTTSLTIHFLRKPPAADVIAETTMLRRGRRLAVAEVLLWSAAAADPVAHATVTYAIPRGEGNRGAR